MSIKPSDSAGHINLSISLHLRFTRCSVSIIPFSAEKLGQLHDPTQNTDQGASALYREFSCPSGVQGKGLCEVTCIINTPASKDQVIFLVSIFKENEKGAALLTRSAETEMSHRTNITDAILPHHPSPF